MILLLHNGRKIPEIVRKIRGLKVAARGVGFEVEFTGNEKTMDPETSDGVQSDGAYREGHLNGARFESFALERLGLEMGVSFSREVRVSRANVFCRRDGFAVKSGRAYAVEVKAAYRPEFRRRYFEQLRRFTRALTDQHRQNLTFIFCVLTDRSIEEIRRQLGDVEQIVGCDVIIRTFSQSVVQKQ